MNAQKHFFKSLFFLIIFCISSCSKCENPKEKQLSLQEISINIQTEPATLDTRKARLLGDFNLIKTFNEGLYRLGKSGVTTSAIAETCSLLEDGKTYVIKLKETLWSNGDPLTAHDFIYAWKSALDKDFSSPNAFLLYPIRNAKAVKTGLLPASMLGIHSQGDYTLVIELENSIPYFLELLTLPIYFPLNQSIVTEKKHWCLSAEDYVCNGPFKITSWKHKNEIIAERNKKYWDKKEVKLQKIKMIMVDQDTAFSMYQNKEIDWTGSPYSQIPSDAIATLEESNILQKDPFLGTYWIRTNIDTYPLQNKNFRKSLACAINRKDIVDHVMSGGAEVATGIVPASMGLQDSPHFQDGDNSEAIRLLEDACKAMNISNKNLPTLTLTYVGTGNNHKIAAAVQDQWKQALGVNIQLEPLEYKVYIDRISKGDYQLSCGSWIADFKDPINFLEVFKTKHVGTNNTNWESLDYIKAIDATYTCINEKERTCALKETEKLLIEEMPVIPIYHYTMLHLQDSKLKDVVLSNTGNIDFKWAYISN